MGVQACTVNAVFARSGVESEVWGSRVENDKMQYSLPLTVLTLCAWKLFGSPGTGQWELCLFIMASAWKYCFRMSGSMSE